MVVDCQRQDKRCSGVACTLCAILDTREPQAAPQPLALTPFQTFTAGNIVPTRLTSSFISTGRDGVKTNWVVASRPGKTGMLRTVIVLHGKSGNADMMPEACLEGALTQLAKAGRHHSPS